MVPTTRNASPTSVLYVDDEARSLRNFARLLGDRFDILTAHSVDEAIPLLDDPDRSIAVLITDQRMPGRTGVDLLHYAREQHPQTVRILTTAYSDLDSAVEAVNQGEVWRYINKPWHPDALYNEIRQALAVFELRAERDQLIAEKQRTLRLLAANARLQALLAGFGGHVAWPGAALKHYLVQTATLNPVSMVDETSGAIRPAEETRLLCAILDECHRLVGSPGDASHEGSTVGIDGIEPMLRDACAERGVTLDPIGDTSPGDWQAAVGGGDALPRFLDCLAAMAAVCGSDDTRVRWTASASGAASELNVFVTPATPPPALFIAQPVGGLPDAMAKRIGRCIALYVLADALGATLQTRSDDAHWWWSLSLPAPNRPEYSAANADTDRAEDIESIFEWFNGFLTR